MSHVLQEEEQRRWMRHVVPARVHMLQAEQRIQRRWKARETRGKLSQQEAVTQPNAAGEATRRRTSASDTRTQAWQGHEVELLKGAHTAQIGKQVKLFP